MLREPKWGLGVPVTRGQAKDIFRVSNTSRSLLSLGKETSGVPPCSWDMFAVTFIDHIYLERKKKESCCFAATSELYSWDSLENTLPVSPKKKWVVLMREPPSGKKGSTWMLSDAQVTISPYQKNYAAKAFWSDDSISADVFVAVFRNDLNATHCLFTMYSESGMSFGGFRQIAKTYCAISPIETWSRDEMWWDGCRQWGWRLV